MKHFNFLSVAVAVVLMVTFISCTTTTGTQDEYYSRPQTTRVYIDDPYRGTLVLEQDPFTGRYYEVNSYGSYYGNRYYGGSRNYNNYERKYNHNYDTDDNRNRDDKRSYNRENQNTHQQQPQSTQQQRKDQEQNKNEARKKILGN